MLFKEEKLENTRWIKTIKDKYLSGISNLFIITGNIGDYAIPGVTFLDYLVRSLKELKMERVITYDYSSGSTYMYGEPEEVSYTNDWAVMIEDLQNRDNRVAYIIQYPEFLFPNTSVDFMDDASKKRLIDLHKVINKQSFLTSDNILIFVTEVTSNINNMFISSNARTVPVNVDYPNENERLEFIKYLRRTSNRKIKSDMDDTRFAKLTAGLTRVNIEDIYLYAESTGVLDKRMIMDRKKELIGKEFGEVIEIFDTEGFSLDKFAGQEHIKRYHKEVVIDPILSGETSIVPMGMLYCGAPGTGKTYFARCFAGDAGINFIEFKMSKILDKWVGEAEKRLEKAFNCFESFAPVGVFMDELDQMLSRGDNDSNSVMKNLFGMFLSFLSKPSHRGNIIFIGATNYPNKIDEALKRAGRFDKKIPFLPPEKEERIEVFKIHLNKSKYPYEVKNYETLADKTENYTQAEIENVVIKALELAKRRKSPKIDDELLLYSIDCMFSAQNARIQEMTDLALEECNDLEFLPDKYKDIKRNMIKRTT